MSGKENGTRNNDWKGLVDASLFFDDPCGDIGISLKQKERIEKEDE